MTTDKDLLAAADRLSDAVARYYRALEDSVNDVAPSRKAMFEEELKYSTLRELHAAPPADAPKTC